MAKKTEEATTEQTETETSVVQYRPPAFDNQGIILSNFDDLVRFANAVAESGLAPANMKSAQAIAVAIQMGLEVGLTPMAALQNVAVVNGRPTLWGDAQLAVCRGSGEMDEFQEFFEVGGQRVARRPTELSDDVTAVCRVVRRGIECVETFSVADAKKAKLWGKQGPWSQYPHRMLKYRARGFALRDTFGDRLRGFRSAEEMGDVIDVPAAVVSDKRVQTSKYSSQQPVTATADNNGNIVEKQQTELELEGEYSPQP